MRKAVKVETMKERTLGRTAAARKEAKDQIRVAKGTPEHVGDVRQDQTHCSLV